MRFPSVVVFGAAVWALATHQHGRHQPQQKRTLVSPTEPGVQLPPNGPTYPTKGPVDNSTYDYVVVGSGPGGAPVAARLALAGFSVLLIDAGEDHGTDPQVEVPALHVLSSEHLPISWDYFVDHYDDPVQAKKDSKMSYRTPDGQWYTGLNPPPGSEQLGVLYPRVGALGGCSQHNALVTILPNNKDWDYIAQITGDGSWSAKNMRKYYERLEKCNYVQPKGSPGHGYSGWLETQVTPLHLVAQDLKVTSLVLAAASAVGQNIVGKLLTTIGGLAQVLLLDVNNDQSGRDKGEAIYQIPLSMKGSEYKRSSPRDWVVEIATAKNPDGTRKYKLDIALNTLVTKVNFDTSGATPKATGVDFLFGSSLYKADPRASAENKGIAGSVNAAREVIVSGGTFNTPQLLKLSGVGPKEELQSFNIPVIKDLPGVGTNMQDRYEVGIVGKAPTEFDLLKKCTFLEGNDPCYNDWKTLPGASKGAYTTNGIAFGLLHGSSQAENGPDLFLGGVPASFRGYYPGYAQEAIADLSIWTWLTLKTHSRNNAGTVTLRSTDPRDTPRIAFRSFSGVGGAADLQAVYEGMRYGIQAFEDLIPLGGKFERTWPPKNISTEAQLKEFARNEAWGHHASCTAAIGADSDPMAVLDKDFRVRGVQNLRVVDASSFPKIPGAYIVLALYMMSEKAADAIISNAKAA